MELLSLPTSPQISSAVEFGASEGSLWLDASCPQDLQALLSRPYPDSIKMSKSQRILKGHKTYNNWKSVPETKHLKFASCCSFQTSQSMKSGSTPVSFTSQTSQNETHWTIQLQPLSFEIEAEHHWERWSPLYQLPKAVLGDTYNFFQMKSNPGPSWCKNPEIFSAEKSKCQANWNVAGYLREDSGDFAGKMWKSARRGFIKCNLPPTIACGPLFNSKRSSCNIFRSQACSFLHPELGDGLGL